MASESMEEALTPNQKLILSVLEGFEKKGGATQIDLEMAGIKADGIADDLTGLLQMVRVAAGCCLALLGRSFGPQHMIEVLTADGTTKFKLQAANKALAYSGLSVDELMVLQAIERAENAGVWTRHLKLSTKLPQQMLTKVLKKLESKKLVKVVKDVTHKNRKMYMAFELTPSREVSGGPWYTDQELDTEFIKAIRVIILNILRKGGPRSRVQILTTVSKAGVAKVALNVDDIQQILDTLIFDGSVSTIPSSTDTRGSFSSASASSSSGAVATASVSGCSDSTMFQIASLPEPEGVFGMTPCGGCPVFDKCTPGGLVSPEKCIYLTSWLDM
jgi:DNA-directed RNA polymerase III subunit RPC6